MSGDISPLTVDAARRFLVGKVPSAGSSSDEAVAALIDTASPAVIRSGAASAGVARLLRPDDLRSAFHGESVTVSVSESGAFRYESGATTFGQRMSFADYASYVENANHQSAERRYLSQFPLDINPLVLGADSNLPSYVPEGSVLVAKNLWFGPAGTISPLHFDRSHNLLFQHWGRKHVVMVAPRYSPVLEPGAKNSESPHVSSLDLVTSGSTIDLSQLDAPCLETILEPGDVLFVPAFWWHNVVSIDAAISVNYWWRPPIGACLHPSFFRMLSSRAVYHDPSIVDRWVDVAPHRLDTGLCLFLVDRGHVFGAAALAGALVTAFCGNTLELLGIGDPLDAKRADGASTMPNFAQMATMVRALVVQGLIDGSQSDLLVRWLELAEETAAEPESRVYGAERSAEIRDLMRRLHVELGRWLETR